MKKNGNRHTVTSRNDQDSAVALASGIADDFNNILTTVMGACSLIDKEDAASKDLLQYVDIIRASAERAVTLSERLACAGAAVHDDAKPVRRLRKSGSAVMAKRDKSAKDGTVSSTKSSGGTFA